MAQAVYIRIVAGRIRREWCDRCMTSARMVAGLYRLADDGPHLVTTYDRCSRCDRGEEDR